MKKQLLIFVAIVAFAFGFYSVPASASTTTYVVQQGDSLWKISRQFKVSFSQILSANKNLSNPSLIYPNQKITLPAGAGTSTATNSEADNIGKGNASAIAGSVSGIESEVLRLVNAERSKQGLNANYTEIGVGYYKGGSYGTEWVQIFIGN